MGGASTIPHEVLLRLTREGLVLALLVSAPPILASWGAGLLVGILQAATQIQDQTVSFVPRLLAVSVTLLVLGSTLVGQLLRFWEALLLAFPRLR
jgi:type III secretory pathway component EscS